MALINSPLNDIVEKRNSRAVPKINTKNGGRNKVKEEVRLSVLDVGSNVTEKDVMDIFKEVLIPILDISLDGNGAVEVTLEGENDAKHVLEHAQGIFLKGKPMKIVRATDNRKQGPGGRIIVANLGKDVTSDEIKELFEDLEGYRGLKHEFGLESAQVSFASLEQAKAAKDIFDKVYIRDKPIMVRVITDEYGQVDKPDEKKVLDYAEGAKIKGNAINVQKKQKVKAEKSKYTKFDYGTMSKVEKEKVKQKLDQELDEYVKARSEMNNN